MSADSLLRHERIGANNIGLGTGGVLRLAINSSGDVVIGASSALAKLDVRGTVLFGTDNWTGRLSFGTGANYYFDATGTSTATSGLALKYWNGSNYGSAMSFDSSGNLIQTAPTAPPTLTAANQLVINLTSNTNARISARGSDGVTRVGNIQLA